MTQQKQLPIITTRDRSLSVSIFKREKDGKIFYGACLQRSFKREGSDAWEREQINLFPDDLLRIANLAVNSYNSLTGYVQQNKTTQTSYPAQEIPADQPDPFDDEIPF